MGRASHLKIIFLSSMSTTDCLCSIKETCDQYTSKGVLVAQVVNRERPTVANLGEGMLTCRDSDTSLTTLHARGMSIHSVVCKVCKAVAEEFSKTRTKNADQEEGLRKAAKKIETMIKEFEQSYAVRDKQDVLAMCALQFAAQVEQKVIDKDTDMVNVEERLNALGDLLQDHL